LADNVVKLKEMGGGSGKGKGLKRNGSKVLGEGTTRYVKPRGNEKGSGKLHQRSLSFDSGSNDDDEQSGGYNTSSQKNGRRDEWKASSRDPQSVRANSSRRQLLQSAAAILPFRRNGNDDMDEEHQGRTPRDDRSQSGRRQGFEDDEDEEDEQRGPQPQEDCNSSRREVVGRAQQESVHGRSDEYRGNSKNRATPYNGGEARNPSLGIPSVVTNDALLNPTPSTVSAATGGSSAGSGAMGSYKGMWLSGAAAQAMDLFALQKKQRLDSVKGYVKDTLFRKVKFVVEDEHLSWDFDMFAVPILKHLLGAADVDNEKRKTLWSEIMPVARKALQDRRSSVNGAVKAAVVGE
jgi:hypothetical protein